MQNSNDIPRKPYALKGIALHPQPTAEHWTAALVEVMHQLWRELQEAKQTAKQKDKIIAYCMTVLLPHAGLAFSSESLLERIYRSLHQTSATGEYGLIPDDGDEGDSHDY
jgi:hypothetical protein